MAWDNSINNILMLENCLMSILPIFVKLSEDILMMEPLSLDGMVEILFFLLESMSCFCVYTKMSAGSQFSSICFLFSQSWPWYLASYL